jgi:hypothetical protein
VVINRVFGTTEIAKTWDLEIKKKQHSKGSKLHSICEGRQQFLDGTKNARSIHKIQSILT